MLAPVLMVVGTASSVGKSTLVSALCRIAARRGIRVAPFKAQNMSNNAAVTANGEEIARSIAVQAAAAKLAPSVQMNPILIKPEGQRRSQIIVQGRPWRTLDAIDYWQRKQMLWDIVSSSLDNLRQDYDLVIAEGAGSPVELNLKAHDITNMRVATYAQAQTLLVGDIDVGGIFAAMLGTLMLLEPEERQLIAGLIVNRFRGDPALFTDGIAMLEQRSNKPVLGVVPWLPQLGLPEEDAVALERPAQMATTAGLTIGVIQLPAIANFDDFDPLAQEQGVAVRYIKQPHELADCHALIVPGTKHTLAARQWLSEQGFDQPIQQFQGPIVGICGGYQLLGQQIDDPQALEGNGGSLAGLGLLPITTVFSSEKQTRQVHATSHLAWAKDCPLTGYEIHLGRTTLLADQAALTIELAGSSHPDGCMRADGKVWGCYLHGIFANQAFRHAWLGSLGWQAQAAQPASDPFERLADHVEQALEPNLLAKLLSGEQKRT
ncbi:cobyric acid synthase [Herpetosiphon sp. NSE202]|uniref:cobyric acid synthase n=1 Tax=Herpetosiphon sp. NSE202 TaxID=3351349 RepID=UPI003630DC92